MIKYAYVALLVACRLLAACGGDAGRDDNHADGGALNDAGGRSPALRDFSAFDHAVDTYLQAHDLAGASAAVVNSDDGIVHERGYGAFAKDRMYLIASTSKVLSVGVLMRLSDRGALDIDAPINRFLADWGDFKSNINVAQLVSNSSGLVGLLDNALYGPYLCQYLAAGTLADCAKAIYTADDAADRKTPDTEFHYGGGQWQLSGGIAEIVSGKSWAKLIYETYVAPCGTPSLGYNNHFAQASSGSSTVSYPTFFQGDVGNLMPTDNPSIEGGAYVNVHDYAKIVQMFLQGGVCGNERVLSKAAIARMQTDRIGPAYGGTTPDPHFAGYGLGFWLDRDHPGVVSDPGAYGAILWLDVPRKYGAVIFVEGQATDGPGLLDATKPLLDPIFE